MDKLWGSFEIILLTHDVEGSSSALVGLGQKGHFSDWNEAVIGFQGGGA